MQASIPDWQEMLLVSCRFPPIGGSGVQRVAKLARYLPRHGWRPHVVCAAHRRWPLMDDTLLREIDPWTRVYRTNGWDPESVAARLQRKLARLGERRAESWTDRVYWRMGRVVDQLLPRERELLWVPAAIRVARQIAAARPIRTVLTSGPAHAVHLVGRALRQRVGLTWIADLRDPIVGNWSCRTDGPRARGYWRWLEGLVVAQADHIVLTCREALEALQARHSSLDVRRLTCLPNGFDPADTPDEIAPRECGRFVIAHVGALYRDQGVGPMLEAIRTVRARNLDAARSMELRLVGSVARSQHDRFKPGDEAFVRRVGYVPHHEAIREMRAAHLLFLMTPDNDDGATCIPAKTFEYLGFGGRVAAVARPGSHLHEILARAGGCVLVKPGDPIGLADAIETCFREWRQGHRRVQRDADYLTQFHRESQAGDYARLMERTLAARDRRASHVCRRSVEWRPKTTGAVT